MFSVWMSKALISVTKKVFLFHWYGSESQLLIQQDTAGIPDDYEVVNEPTSLETFPYRNHPPSGMDAPTTGTNEDYNKTGTTEEVTVPEEDESTDISPVFDDFSNFTDDDLSDLEELYEMMGQVDTRLSTNEAINLLLASKRGAFVSKYRHNHQCSFRNNIALVKQNKTCCCCYCRSG